MARARRVVEFHQDFMNATSGTGGGLAGSNAGGGFSVQASSGSQIGRGRFFTGTIASTNQRGGVATGLSQFVPNQAGEITWYADLTPVANFDGTNTGIYHAGVINVVSSLPSNGCYFYSQNGGNFFARTIDSGNDTGTNTDTGVAFTVGTQRFLEIRVNAAGTQVQYFIDGNLVATHNANITTTVCGFGALYVRQAATAFNGLGDMGYFGYRIITATDRYP